MSLCLIIRIEVIIYAGFYQLFIRGLPGLLQPGPVSSQCSNGGPFSRITYQHSTASVYFSTKHFQGNSNLEISSVLIIFKRYTSHYLSPSVCLNPVHGDELCIYSYRGSAFCWFEFNDVGYQQTDALFIYRIILYMSTN